MIAALLAAVLIVIGLYSWDSNARAAEAALRPVPVAPLAEGPPTPTPPPSATAAISPASSPGPATAGVATGDPSAGQARFTTTCSPCHPGGNAGIGPALYGPQFTARYPDDRALVAVIRQGKGSMPAFSFTMLSDQDLNNVIAYARGLGSGAVAAEPTPTPRPRQRGG